MNFDDQWTVYRTRFLVRARQLKQPLIFTDALGREQSGGPGDYVVESSDGVTRSRISTCPLCPHCSFRPERPMKAQHCHLPRQRARPVFCRP